MTDQPKSNQPSSPAPTAQPLPKDESPVADKSPTLPAAATEPKPDAASKPALDAKPEAKPNAVPASESSAPTQPAAPKSSAPQTAQPATPISADSNPPPTTPSAKPVNTEGDKPQSVPVAVVSAVSSTNPTEKLDISEQPTLPGKPAAMGTAASAMPASTPVALPAPPVADKDDTIPPQKPTAKITQRFTEPSPDGQVSSGTLCPTCGHRNRPGTLICDNCGTNLVGGVKSAVGTRDLVSAMEDDTSRSEPLMDAAQLNAVESAGGSVFSDDMVLRVEIEGGATPMLVYPKSEIILGRRDPNTGTLPDVDMTAYSGYRMGVSRTHAFIHLEDKQLNLSDRGSSNGTFLNGTRLVAHRPYPIKDGDEIRLGQMMLKVYFQSNKTRK